MKVGTFSLLGLASALLIGTPALATPLHALQNHQQKQHKVLLNEHAVFARLNLDALRVNLRGDNGKPSHQKEHKHLQFGPRGLHAHGKPGKPTTPPSHDVPMPEPGAALLFALGTGMVATYLRRPRIA